MIQSCLKCRSRSRFHIKYTDVRVEFDFFLFFPQPGWSCENLGQVYPSSDPISVCSFPLCDLCYWSYFYCFLKDAGWKPSFNTVHNGIPKQRQASWVHTVSVHGSSLLYKCRTGSRPEDTLLCWATFFVSFCFVFSGISRSCTETLFTWPQ